MNDLQIIWMTRREHLPAVLAIDAASFAEHWTEDDFITCLKRRNCIGMVAEHNGRIVGFMVYELHKSRMRIRNFAVDPDFRRQGVGAAMVDRLKYKLSLSGRQEIDLYVRDANLPAQLFFAAQGFRAVGVVRGHYDDSEDDAYHLRFLHGVELATVNRLTAFFADYE